MKSKRPPCIFVLVMALASCHGDDYRGAANLYEAGEYARSRAVLEGVAGATRWHRALLLYDQALAALGEGDYVAAQELLESVYRQAGLPSLLRYRSGLALLLALGRQADRQLEEGASGGLPVGVQTMNLLRRAWLLLEDVGGNRCALLRGKGYATCGDAPSTGALRRWLAALNDKAWTFYTASLMRPANLEAAFWTIQGAAASWKNALTTMHDIAEPALYEAYRRQLTITVRPFKELLRHMDALREQAPALQQQAFTALSAALAAFFEGVEQGLGVDALSEALLRVDVALEQAMTVLYGDLAAGDAVAVLYRLYSRLMSLPSLQHATVQGIVDRQRRFFEQAQQKGGLSAELNAVLQEALASGDAATAALRQGRTTLGRLHLAVARQLLRQLSVPWNISEEALLQDLLQELVDRQRLTLQMVELAGGEPVDERSLLAAPLRRLVALSTGPAAHFQDVMMMQQQRDYARGRCQWSPWNELIPLFYKGLSAAHGAGTALEGQQEALSLTKTYKALQVSSVAWQQALDLLRRPPGPAPASCYQKPPQQGEGGGGGPAPSAADEVLRQLQQMSEQDKLEQPRDVFKTEGKPW